MRFVHTRFDITNPIAYDENKAIESRERNLDALQQHSIEGNMIPIPMKEIDAPLFDAPSSDDPPFDDGYPTWEEINWTNYPPRSEDRDDSVCEGYTNRIKFYSYIQHVY